MEQLSSQLAAAAVFGACLASLAPAQDFRAAPPFEATVTPSGSFFRQDFDANGQDDLVIVDFTAATNFSSISVLLNPGIEAPFVDLQVLYEPIFGFVLDLEFADMNSDGNLDIVVHQNGTFAFAEVFYLPGDGAGGFLAPVQIAQAVDKSTRMSVGDFNGDGQADVVYVDIPFTDDPLSFTVMTQDAGVFTAAHTETLPGTLRRIRAGDYDGDGLDDIAWFGDGTISILSGTTGAFGTPVSTPIPPEFNDGYADDVDNDGFEDLVLQESEFGSWKISVFYGAEVDPLVTSQVIVPAGNPSRCDFLGNFDVDGDGIDDLLASIRDTSGYTLIRNDGNRGFSPAPYLTDMLGGLIDLDQDGDLDQIARDFFGSGYLRLENLARYGDACSGTTGDPVLELTAPTPGNADFMISIEDATPFSLAQIFLSTEPFIQPSCGVQIDLSRLILPGPGMPIFLGLTDAAGSSRLSLPLPLGVPDGPYFAQGLVLDPMGEFPLGGYSLSMTGGRAMRLY